MKAAYRIYVCNTELPSPRKIKQIDSTHRLYKQFSVKNSHFLLATCRNLFHCCVNSVKHELFRRLMNQTAAAACHSLPCLRACHPPPSRATRVAGHRGTRLTLQLSPACMAQSTAEPAARLESGKPPQRADLQQLQVADEQTYMQDDATTEVPSRHTWPWSPNHDSMSATYVSRSPAP